MAMRETTCPDGKLIWKKGTFVQVAMLTQSPWAENQLVCRLLSQPLIVDQLLVLYWVLDTAVAPGRRARFSPTLKVRPRKEPCVFDAVNAPVTRSAGTTTDTLSTDAPTHVVVVVACTGRIRPVGSVMVTGSAIRLVPRIATVVPGNALSGV